jgi:hypothetical protein
MTGQPGDPYQPYQPSQPSPSQPPTQVFGGDQPFGGFGAPPPGPGGPAGPPPGPPHRRLSERHVLIGAGALLAVLAIVGFVLPGRSTDTASTRPAVTAPGGGAATSPSPAVSGLGSGASSAAGGDCPTQVQDWSGGGATRDIDGLASSIETFGQDMTALGDDLDSGTSASADEAKVHADAAQVQSAAQTVQGDPTPACVPGLRADLNGAASACSTSAVDATNGLNQLSSGNLSVADRDVRSAATAIRQGNVKASAASTDINKFNTSQG